MSTKPTTPAAIDHAAENQQLRRKLNEIDAECQDTVCAIGAMCGAAKARLAPSASALLDVDRLLDLISAAAELLANDCNVAAAQYDANHVDDARHKREAEIDQMFKVAPHE